MDKKLIFLSSIFFILSLFFTASLFLREDILPLLRAKETYEPSPNLSIVLAFPLEVKANGKDQGRITVFVRNKEGSPLSKKKVRIKTNLGQITPEMQESDENGKAEFYIKSKTPGLAKIIPIVDNTTIQNNITIKFK